MVQSIQLPANLYEAVQREAATRQKTVDNLVTEWVAERLKRSEKEESIIALEREIAVFEQMRPQLLLAHEGDYVAIYQGKVVAAGSEKLSLLGQVREQFGNVICYIEQVTSDAPRKVRLPSLHRVRS